MHLHGRSCGLFELQGGYDWNVINCAAWLRVTVEVYNYRTHVNSLCSGHIIILELATDYDFSLRF